MNQSSIAYFSKMYQAVPAIAPIQKITGGTFVTNRKSTEVTFLSMFPDLHVKKYQRWAGAFNKGKKILSEADIIITGSPYKEFLNPYKAKKYMVFHGTYMMLSEEAVRGLSHFDKLFLTGPRMEQMLSRHKCNVETHTTGFLPFSLYPNKSAQHRESVLTKLGLDPNKKTIVYTPSRSKIGSWMACAEDLAKVVPNKYNLIMRPHPSQALTARADDRKSYKLVNSILEGSKNGVLDLITCSLPEILSVADLVISDANSPAEESLFYDVPQLFIETDRFSRDAISEMANQEGLHPDDLEQLLTLYDCGNSTSGKEDWIKNIENAMSDKSKLEDSRHNYFNWVFGSRDKNVAQNVADFINSTL